MVFNRLVGAQEISTDIPVNGPGIRFTLPSSGIESLQEHSAGLTWSWILDGFFAYGDSENALRDGGPCNTIVGFTDEHVHAIVLAEDSEFPIFYVALNRPGLRVALTCDVVASHGRGQILRAELRFFDQMFVVVADGALQITAGGTSMGNELQSFGALLESYAPVLGSRSLEPAPVPMAGDAGNQTAVRPPQPPAASLPPPDVARVAPAEPTSTASHEPLNLERGRLSRWIAGSFILIAAIVAGLLVRQSMDDSGDSFPPTTASGLSEVESSADFGGVPEPNQPDELPVDLVVSAIASGSGPPVVAGDMVEVLYVGYLSADGTVFDENYTSGTAFRVTVGSGGVIKGWDQGLVGVQLGGRYQLDIPARLAYGDVGNGDLIKPGESISFIIDIIAITTADGTRTVA